MLEDRGNGLGPIFGYYFGRWSADTERRDREIVNLLHGRRSVTVDQSYIDQLHNQIQQANADMQHAENVVRGWIAETDKWKTYAHALEAERDAAKQNAKTWEEQTLHFIEVKNRHLRAAAELNFFAETLRRFAELGLANEPEYKQLAVRYQAAWADFDTRIPNTGEIFQSLVAALERKLAR